MLVYVEFEILQKHLSIAVENAAISSFISEVNISWI